MAIQTNKKARPDMIGKSSKKWVKKARMFCITTWPNGLQHQEWELSNG